MVIPLDHEHKKQNVFVCFSCDSKAFVGILNKYTLFFIA